MEDLPIFSALKRQMKWLTANQKVIAQNVANADTPGYKAKEMARLDFGNLVSRLDAQNDDAKSRVARASLKGTQTGHLGAGASMPTPRDSDAYEENPDGNAVSLEEEMIKSSGNQMEYSLVVSLYEKQVQLLKSALKAGGR